MRKLFARLNLVQKVTITLVVLSVITSLSMAVVVSQVIRQSYLNEQKRSVSQFVLKQAAQYLTASELQNTDFRVGLEKFDIFRATISTPDVAEVTIFNTYGKVLSADDPTVVGKQLSKEALDSLKLVFGGSTIASVDQPILEKGRNELKNSQLLRIYIPLIFDDANVVGAVEVTIQLASLNSEITRSQVYALSIITAIILIAFLILYITIRQASITLVKQDQQLRIDIQKEQEYSKLKSEFINMASHQLRTPTTTILWSLEELNKDIEDKLSSEQIETAQSAQLAAQTLAAIVDNMLIDTDIKPDYFSFETNSYPLEALVREILDKYKESSAKKQLKIDFQSSAGIIQTNLKRSALTLVIEALLKNAVDYSPVNNSISVIITTPPQAAQIEITDQGIGIPQQERVKVFGQFFRGSNSIEQKNVGSGLSLYIAHKIVTGYGGTLQYTSLGKGSRFILTIPIITTG